MLALLAAKYVLRHLGIYNCNGSSHRGFDVSVLILLCLELLIVGLGVIDVKVGELEYHLLAVGERFVQRLLLFLEGNELDGLTLIVSPIAAALALMMAREECRIALRSVIWICTQRL